MQEREFEGLDDGQGEGSRVASILCKQFVQLLSTDGVGRRSEDDDGHDHDEKKRKGGAMFHLRFLAVCSRIKVELACFGESPSSALEKKKQLWAYPRPNPQISVVIERTSRAMAHGVTFS